MFNLIFQSSDTNFRGTVVMRIHHVLAFSITSAPQHMEMVSEPALVFASIRIQAMHRNPKLRFQPSGGAMNLNKHHTYAQKM